MFAALAARPAPAGTVTFGDLRTLRPLLLSPFKIASKGSF